jgi:hypothetical protein
MLVSYFAPAASKDVPLIPPVTGAADRFSASIATAVVAEHRDA